jgi:amidase
MPTMARSAQESRVFQLEEATIEDLHGAIQSGLTTCARVVRHYIDRVRAFNGVSSMLVTEDGATVPPTLGPVRGQAPIVFPTATIKASTLLPDLDKYRGPPLEYGRMEATASDSSVQQ